MVNFVDGNPDAVFPAPAGINRYSGVITDVRDCVPRASGDKPLDWFRHARKHQCSPRQRG
ncbi:TPA: hypothetical protein IOH10_004670 [Salmonella enterica]|nr:hypothetical protein [Salmonella enterica]